MKIALYGIGGTYNYGCDAIIRGTERIIHNKFPDAEIDYLSLSFVDDVERLADVDVNIINLTAGKVKKFIQKFIIKLNLLLKQRFFGLLGNAYYRLLVPNIKKYDYVLSIGGDIYTLPPRNEYVGKKNYTNLLLEFGKYCKRNEVPMIIWGASIGPFDDDAYMKDVFLSHIKECAHFIVVREKKTDQYLLDNGVLNYSLYGDPAFAIPYDRRGICVENKIGINLSPLSFKYANNGQTKDEWIEEQAKVLVEIQKYFGSQIVLIPHVFSQSENDDDFSYLEKIKNKAEVLGVKVELVKTEGFVDAKKELSKCKLVISARMHCAINSICCGTPAIFLSYSEKAKGMSEMVYGTEKFAVSINEFVNKDFIIPFIEKALYTFENIDIEQNAKNIGSTSLKAVDIF